MYFGKANRLQKPLSLRGLPFLKILFLLVIGIVVADNINISEYRKIVYFTVIISSMAFLLSVIFQNQLLNIVIPIVFFVSVGSYLYISSIDETDAKHFANTIIKDDIALFKAEIKDVVKTKYGAKIIAKISAVEQQNITQKTVGNLLVYVKNSMDTVANYERGNTISFYGYVHRITKNSNPLVFNLRRYYYYRNIHYKTYVKSQVIKLLAQDINWKYKPINFFSRLNSTVKIIIRKHVKEETNANVLISIILGDKRNLDPEILSSFTATGTRHILTVSGMHVGIVALILNFLFSFFPTRKPFLKTIKILVILTGIWFYAFLTGYGAAVIRASVMISMVMVGINLRKMANIFNILFASAFILLLTNPLQLFQLSFILSYTAMLSILIFYNPVYSIIKLDKYRILDYIWKLLSLSIAAQILIFPLSIYYFHNGPLLFILTALIATPMAFAVMFMGFGMVFFHYFSTFLANLLGITTGWVLQYSLSFIKYVESISVNIGNHIYFEKIDIVLIFVFSAFIYLFFTRSRRFYSIPAIIIMLLFLVNQYSRINNSRNENELVIYAISNFKLMDIYLDGICYIDKEGDIDDEQLKYFAGNYRLYKYPERFEVMGQNFKNDRIEKYSNILKLDDKIIVSINSKEDYFPESTSKIDVLLIGDEVKFELDDLNENYKIEELVLAKGINYYTRKYWKRQADKHEIPVYDVSEKGYYLQKLN